MPTVAHFGWLCFRTSQASLDAIHGTDRRAALAASVLATAGTAMWSVNRLSVKVMPELRLDLLDYWKSLLEDSWPPNRVFNHVKASLGILQEFMDRIFVGGHDVLSRSPNFRFEFG